MKITSTTVFKMNHHSATQAQGEKSFDRVSITWVSEKKAFELITEAQYGTMTHVERAMFLAKSLKFAIIEDSDDDVLFNFSECGEYIIATRFR